MPYPHRRCAVLVALLWFAGCSSPNAPPPRDSPELVALGTTWLDDLVEIRSRGGVSMIAEPHGDVGSIIGLDAMGARVVREVPGGMHGLCVIGQGSGVFVTWEGVAIFDRDTTQLAVAPEVFEDRAPFAGWPVQCSALSAEDVWTLSEGLLGHWDGERWSFERVAPLETELIAREPRQALSVTEAFVWLSATDGVYRRPRTGGSFERVVVRGAHRELRDLDATHVGVLISDDGYGLIGAEVHGDTGDVAVTEIANDLRADDRAVFDPAGGLWLATLESDGVGHGPYFDADYHQVVLSHTDGAGGLVELGHHDQGPGSSWGGERLWLLDIGGEVAVGFMHTLFRLPRVPPRP